MKNLKVGRRQGGDHETGAGANAVVLDLSSQPEFSLSTLSASTSTSISGAFSERSMSSSVTSVSVHQRSSSCSSEEDDCCSGDQANSSGTHGGTGEAADALLLMGCVGCLMYVMVPRWNQRCPRCRTLALVRLFQ